MTINPIGAPGVQLDPTQDQQPAEAKQDAQAAQPQEHHHHHHHGVKHADRAQDNLNTLAQALDQDPSQLLDQLSSGADVSSLLAKVGGYGSSSSSSALASGLAVDQDA